jgi:hypothetical protein
MDEVFYAWFIVWVLWQVLMKLHTLRFSVMRHEFRSLYLLLRVIPFTSVKYHVVAYLAEYSHEGEISWIQVKVICKSKCYFLHNIYTSLAVLFFENVAVIFLLSEALSNILPSPCWSSSTYFTAHCIYLDNEHASWVYCILIPSCYSCSCTE